MGRGTLGFFPFGEKTLLFQTPHEINNTNKPPIGIFTFIHVVSPV
jgi:hypothetical protein